MNSMIHLSTYSCGGCSPQGATGSDSDKMYAVSMDNMSPILACIVNDAFRSNRTIDSDTHHHPRKSYVR